MVSQTTQVFKKLNALAFVSNAQRFAFETTEFRNLLFSKQQISNDRNRSKSFEFRTSNDFEVLHAMAYIDCTSLKTRLLEQSLKRCSLSHVSIHEHTSPTPATEPLLQTASYRTAT
jgi:hypothetical protein